MRMVLAGLVLLAACSGDGKDKDGTEYSAELVFEDANNYSYTGELEISQVEIQSATDACADWSLVDTDLRGRSLDPSSVEQVLLVEFNLTPEEIIQKVEINDLAQSDTQSQWLYFNSGATTTCLSDFSIIGNPFVPETYMTENPARTWLMSLVKLPEGRLDILMSQFVIPRDASSNTDIVFNNTSSVLTADADFTSSPAIETQEGIGPYTLDWSGVTTDVNGKAFDPLLGDELLIAHYDVSGPADVEDLFLRLDSEADSLYRLNVYGLTYSELADAEDADGNAFPGFTADGVWLVGILCTTCTAPVPLMVGVVSVAPAG